MSAYEGMLVERPRPGVVLATLNRPERLNALSFAMFEAFPRLCAELEADPEARVLVLTGAGRGFCAGLDLEEAARLGEMSAAEMLAGQERWVGGIASLRALRKPVIAAVNGPAAGAGLALALMADLRIASGEARFATAFVRIGLSGGDVGVSWLLPRLVGLTHASELMLTGEPIGAERAERIGLLNAVVEPEALLEAAYARAAAIAANSPLGVRLTKQVLQQNVDAPSLAAAMETENRNQVLISQTDDMQEALAAFREKRSPRWSGR
ncbi:MAG: enoyl-CoA hydratase/isomerase family protein [Solirubrobacterales bacterium]